MFSFIWHTFFFDPVYNALVFFIDVIPGGDVGLAIIATVILVKVLLFPLSLKAVKTQKLMRELEPKLKAIKEEFKDKREEQAKAMLALYKDAGMNPFASILLMFVQIPFVIALYLVVANGSAGIALPSINPEILYSFVANPGLDPALISMSFLGMIDIAAKNLPLALLAGITQFFSTKLSLPALPPREPDAAPDLKEDLMRNMQIQMKYVMPFVIVVVAYTFSAAIALYFVVSNLVMIFQEIIVRKHR
jgi:YidC/Oxa1 family membrane protein insertase